MSATGLAEAAGKSSGPVFGKTMKKRWVSYIWDTFDKSPEERRLIFKLDSAILTFASLGYFIKYLDQTNINNAFVSGMKEDLGLYGNQLNYMQTRWTVGYVIGEIPSLAESTFYPGMQYIIGSCYRKDELAKRSCIFHTSSGIASMFSGYLMNAVYHLGGRGVAMVRQRHSVPQIFLPHFKRLFLVDGIMTLPIAISGFFLLPDVPEISSPWYLSKEEVALAQRRMKEEGRNNRGPYTKAKLKKIFSSWHIYLLTLLYILFNNGATGAQPVFQQFLKASKEPKYSVSQINAYPTTTYAVQVVTTLAYAWSSDSFLNGKRWPPIIFGAMMNIISYVSLAAWDIPIGWKWTCYIICGSGFGLSGLLMAGAHEICSEDNEERSLVIGSMNEMAYVLQAWLPLIVWQQVDAPEYRKGFITVSCLSVSLILGTLVVRRLHLKEKREKRNGAIHIDGAEDDLSDSPAATPEAKISKL
ncbi:uncharacterized protein N7477_004325 [Penicillium maclennaniae]|uniref:uncharacterized protein n=1 Tax=Penicillium maclennaniae TaxID=1343394 RepID=UPI002540C7CE|nr:uncharacterized protein N7477_004325 [Penicillium maclennaniae]KAJ5674391.1 hypothetical protein N7477_004325 [Penicillium maclennaniae]